MSTPTSRSVARRRGTDGSLLLAMHRWRTERGVGKWEIKLPFAPPSGFALSCRFGFCVMKFSHTTTFFEHPENRTKFRVRTRWWFDITRKGIWLLESVSSMIALLASISSSPHGLERLDGAHGARSPKSMRYGKQGTRQIKKKTERGAFPPIRAQDRQRRWRGVGKKSPSKPWRNRAEVEAGGGEEVFFFLGGCNGNKPKGRKGGLGEKVTPAKSPTLLTKAEEHLS
jgi:hypothetical protein